MITRVDAFHYRCIRYMERSLRPFQVLVGPNASGKTTFLDVLAFLSRVQAVGIDEAIEERSSNFADLVWGRKNAPIRLAITAEVPPSVAEELSERKFKGKSPSGWDKTVKGVRYEIGIGPQHGSERAQVLSEQIYLLAESDGSIEGDPDPFDYDYSGNEDIVEFDHPNGRLHQVVYTRDDVAHPEHDMLNERGESYFVNGAHVSRSRSRTLLSSLWPNGFPVSSWLASYLTEGVVHIRLEDSKLHAPSPPGKSTRYLSDGSNIPWIVERLQQNEPERYAWWIEHVQTALPDLEGIRVIDRPEDRHRYLMLRYRGGLEIPSWIASDGTLRFLALSLLAYSSDAPRISLVEEPENSIHPLNIELLMQALRSTRDRQILVTTHSPTVISCTEAQEILVFSRDSKHGARVTQGDQHPGLANWKGSPDLSLLYASGVFG